ncbi:MAG: hypothetical protein Q9195_006129 [Heterodermia aff. obscurata]
MTAQHALVIGANRGIGLQIVQRLTKRNWVVAGSIRPQTRGDPSVKELEETGAQVIEIDYLDEETIVAAAKEYEPNKLDLLVNCGGVGPEPSYWYEHTAEIMLEKFRGPFLATKHFYPALKRSNSARIINIASGSASAARNNGEDVGYRMSKVALTHQSITLAKEFVEAGDNIAVLTIYPGYVATRLSSYRHKNDMKECMDGIVDVMEKASMEQTGTFVDWKNETVPW